MPRRPAISSILIVAAAALAPLWAGAQPASPNVPNIVVPGSDGAPMLLLGFFAFGNQEAIDRLAAAVREQGLQGGDVEAEGDEKEYGVIFNGSTTREQAFAFIERARSGEFGPLRLDYVMVPPSAVRRPSR